MQRYKGCSFPFDKKEVTVIRTHTTVLSGLMYLLFRFTVAAGDTIQKLYMGSLGEGEFELKDLCLTRASESKPVLPTWNSDFELDSKTGEPRGWTFYAFNPKTGPTVGTVMEPGCVEIFGKRNFGLHTAPLDLSSFVEKRVRFSALVETPISGYIEFWGKHEKDRTNFSPSSEWQSVSVKTIIEAGNTSQRLYIGSLGGGSLKVKDLRLEVIPE